MRLLREKHGISFAELSRHGGVSRQRLSEIELDTRPVSIHINRLVETAFAGLITARQRDLSALESDFQIYRNNLLDYADKEERL